MTTEALLLIGRGSRNAQDLLSKHATALTRRGVAESVRTATYESEPVRELRDPLESLDADRVYAVPMIAAHDHETIRDVPAALSYVSGEVQLCEPIGGSPVVTDVVRRRATAHVSPAQDVSLALVSFGSSSKPYHRQLCEYHASRLREQTDFGEVKPCYLLQNPAVECVRYSVSGDRLVVVPLFVVRNQVTEEKIPDKLELDRGEVAYADPVGDHDRITDAIQAEFEKQRVLAGGTGPTPAGFETSLTQNTRPLAADGEGPPR